jgi:uncharacterized protein
MPTQVPIVDYLVLGDKPHLRAQECQECAARYFDHRDACASCFGTTFAPVDLPTNGTLITYTIVTFAAPGVPTPFVAGVVDCDGTSVRANVVGVEHDKVRLGMPLQLTTFAIGTDDNGDEAVGFGFEPLS